MKPLGDKAGKERGHKYCQHDDAHEDQLPRAESGKVFGDDVDFLLAARDGDLNVRGFLYLDSTISAPLPLVSVELSTLSLL